VSGFDVRNTIQSAINFYVDIGEPVLNVLFGGFGWNGLYLFERLLLFIILVAIIYLALGRIDLFEEQKVIRRVVSIIIPLIGIRFINYEWMHAILTQYTVLAIVLTAAIPFLLFFFFVYEVGDSHDIFRKILWLLFIGIYAGLWSTSEAEESTIYAWTTIAAIICLILDTTIMRRYRAIQLMKSGRGNSNQQLIAIDKKLAELNQAIDNSWGDPKETQKQIKKLTKHRGWLIKQI